MGCGRVHERHLRPLGAWTRRLVDEADAARLEVGERRRNVLDAQRDVVDAGTALLDEFRNGRIGRGRFEQLQGGLSDRDEVRPDTLRPHVLGRLDVEAERVPVERQRLVDVLDRDADVIENSSHLES